MIKFLSWIGFGSLLICVAVLFAISKDARDVVIYTGQKVFFGDSVSPSPLGSSQPNNPDLSIVEATLHDFMGRLNQHRFEDAYYYAYFQPSSRGNIKSFVNFWKRYQPNSIIYDIESITPAGNGSYIARLNLRGDAYDGITERIRISYVLSLTDSRWQIVDER